MKGITPIISIIVLLLITVALAGAAWSYLQIYWTGMTGKTVSVVSSFCVGGNTAVVLLRHTGTLEMNPAQEIIILNASSPTGALATVTWQTPQGEVWAGNLKPGDMIKMTANCAPTGTLCSFRIVTDAASIEAAVQC